MSFIDAIILGIVEGLTEFLPVSSTGHLILASKLLELETSEFLKTFEIVIQSGAILAVVMLYWRRLFTDRETIKRIIVALLPAIGIGFVFYQSIRAMLASDTVVLWAMGIGGVLIILFELFRKGKQDELQDVSLIPYKTAFLIGVCQAISVIPGVSRSGATILGGLMLGLSRTAIVEFSFLLAVPTMVAATTLDLVKNASMFSISDAHLLFIGFIVSFFVAIAAVKFFLRFVQSHTFIPFGIYRIAVALLFFFFVI